MKKLVQLLVLLVLLIPHSWAGEREDILDLVFKWNDLHNTKETMIKIIFSFTLSAKDLHANKSFPFYSGGILLIDRW